MHQTEVEVKCKTLLLIGRTWTNNRSFFFIKLPNYACFKLPKFCFEVSFNSFTLLVRWKYVMCDFVEHFDDISGEITSLEKRCLF